MPAVRDFFIFSGESRHSYAPVTFSGSKNVWIAAGKKELIKFINRIQFLQCCTYQIMSYK